jgi:putative transposase
MKTEQDLNDFSRNDCYSKTLITEDGQFDVDSPRDHHSSIEPQLVKKHQARLTAMDQNIHCLYAKGMTIREMTCRMH